MEEKPGVGPDWTPINPSTGSFFHADSQRVQQTTVSVMLVMRLSGLKVVCAEVYSWPTARRINA